jgi:hypothetical protein
LIYELYAYSILDQAHGHDLGDGNLVSL